MARTVSVKLMADVSQFVGGLKRAGASTKDFAGEMDRAAKAGKLDAVANHAAGVGVALAGMAGYAIKSAADFEKSMSGIRAATHASAQDMEALRKAALQAGKDTSFSATQAADGITELSKAGVSTADVLGGGLKGALDLAAAGQLDVGEAAETAATAMTQFKLSGSDVPHIADLLAAGAGKAQGSVHDMGMALKQSGLVAAQMGLSVEDTTGTLAAFASAGLIGSDAGTSLKTAMLMLANPTDKARAVMADYGLELYDAQGKFIGVSALAGQLQTKLAGLTDEQRNAALATIFGSDAIRAASVLYQQGASGVQGWIGKVNDAGYASETAQIQTDNLVGDLERLKGSLQTVAIESGSGASKGLRTLTQAANAAVDAFSSLPGWMQQSMTILTGIGGASLLAMAGFIKVRGSVMDFTTQLREMGPMGGRAADGLGKLGSVAGKMSLVGAAVFGVYEGFKLFSDWAEKRTAPTKANIDNLTQSIKEFAATGKATGELASKYGSSLQQIGQDVSAVTKGMRDLKQVQADVAAGLSDPSVGENWNPIDPQVVQRVKDLDSALTKLVQGGGASQARIFLQQLRSSGKLTADQFDQLTGMLPQYTNAAHGAATANTGLAKGFGTTAANAETMTGSLESATEAGQKLTDIWNQLHGAVVGSDRAMLSANEAIKAVEKSFKENKNAVDGNSNAALRNRVAVGEAAKAAAAAAEAKLEETGSIKEANKVYDSYMGQLRKTLTQSGLTKKQVDHLIDSYGDMPRSVATNVDIRGEEGVNKALDRLLVKQYALAKGLSPTAAAASVQKDLDRNRQRGYHGGGRTADVGEWEPAGIVHGKEVVLNAKTVRNVDQQAPGFLDELHATGQLPGYAGGGRVTWPFPVTASKTRIPSWSEVASKVAGDFGNWPHGYPKYDSGVWRKIVALVNASGIPHEFGNAYRPGDRLWHGCVPMDTRILTRRGWITYDEVVVGEDETIGYNPSTGKNEWTLIVGLHHYEDAEVWKLQNSWFTAEVTPGHKWLVDQQVSVQTETVCTECGREFATGRGMTKHRADVHRVLTPRRERFEEQMVATRDFKQSTRIHLSKPANLGGELPITDDEAELIGWIFGDGYMEPYGPTIVQSKPEQVQYLRTFMSNFACSEYVRAPEGRQTHTIFRWKLSVDYWRDLASRSKASKDDAMNFVLSLSVSQREAFVRGFLSADGTRDPRTQTEDLGYAAFQVSGPVAEAIKVAAYLEGYRPDTRVKAEFDGDRFGTQPMEHIGFRTPIAKSRHLPVVSTRTADVWCPTTTLGTWTARQGEEIFLTGNSGRAVDYMGYNQDRLANFFLARQGQVLEMIHRSNKRDYAYTRGKNKGSFNNPLMQAHRNHLHIAMEAGGTINEPVFGVGASGKTYSMGENYKPERVVPQWHPAPAGQGGGGQITIVLENHGVIGSRMEVETWLTGTIDRLRAKGRV